MEMELEKPKKKVQIKKTIIKSSADLKNLVTKKVKTATPKPDIQSNIVIDHPKTGDKIHPHHYAIRMSMFGGSNAQISIDGGDWMWCRNAGGHYWFDWHSIPQGKHKIVARMKLSTGKFKQSKAVNIVV